MNLEPFWEKTYANKDVTTFQKGPTIDIAEYYGILKICHVVLETKTIEGLKESVECIKSKGE